LNSNPFLRKKENTTPPSCLLTASLSRQITESTWQNQVGHWEQLILSYAKHKQIFRLDVHAATSPGGGEIFENNKIKRKETKRGRSNN
jgi:ESCRT-II complex subunit VPS25